MENILSWTGFKDSLGRIAAVAIRAELAKKSSAQLMGMLQEKHMLALKRQLILEELHLRGISHLNEHLVESEQNDDPDVNRHSSVALNDVADRATPDNTRKSPLTDYIRRHWRGEFELLESFWGNVVFINVLIGIFTSFLVDSETVSHFTENHTGISWFLVIVFAVLMYTIGVWQLVGLWRSANNHVRTTGLRFWAGASKLFVLFSVLGVVWNSYCDVSNIANLTKFAFGLMPFDDYRVTLDEEGRVLSITGGIGYELTDEVDRVLTHNPGIQVIKLDSFGGRLTEALRLHDLIQRHGLTTYSDGKCDSACTIAFLGGQDRVLNVHGQLGFHQPSAGIQSGRCASMESRQTDEHLSKMRREETQRLIGWGIDPSFAKKAMSIPSSEIWRPTHDQLIRAGVISIIKDEA